MKIRSCADLHTGCGADDVPCGADLGQKGSRLLVAAQVCKAAAQLGSGGRLGLFSCTFSLYSWGFSYH